MDTRLPDPRKMSAINKRKLTIFAASTCLMEIFLISHAIYAGMSSGSPLEHSGWEDVLPGLIGGAIIFFWLNVTNIVLGLTWFFGRVSLNVTWVVIGQVVLVSLVALPYLRVADSYIWLGYCAPFIQALIVGIGTGLARR